MSHALVTVRHDARRASVTPGLIVRKSKKPRSDDRHSSADGRGSRRDRNDAQGYEYAAASGFALWASPRQVAARTNTGPRASSTF